MSFAFIQNYIVRLRSLSSVKQLLLVALVLASLDICLFAWIWSPPIEFSTHTIVTIPQGATVSEFAHILKTEKVIRYEFVFKALARLSMLDRSLEPGAYVFTSPLLVSGVVDRIGHGQHGIDPVRITFTEGMTLYDINSVLTAQLPGFNSAVFLKAASTSEGYLFPETYLFMPGDAADDIVVRLRSEFSQQIATITPQILAFKKPFNDVVIMASILEREAKSPEDMRMVAGILWNRINGHIPLQVDATFGYIHQENGYTPTANDLNSDSLYNTYKHLGLPPTPISNPGLIALLAAVTPEKTTNFYYLTGKDGKMHYARTFEEHKKNRALYLD